MIVQKRHRNCFRKLFELITEQKASYKMRNALDLLFFGIFCFGLRAGKEFEKIILWGLKGQTL